MKTMQRMWCVAAAAFAGESALAAPLKVGGQLLEIPLPPDTDMAIGGSQPQLMQLIQAYVGNNRLVEIYARKEEVARIQEDGLSVYCQLQINLRLEDKQVALGEFGRHRADIEEGLSKALGGDEFTAKLREAEASGNRELQRTTGTDLSMSIDKPRYHGVFAREPWGLFYSMEVPVKFKNGDETTTTLQAAASAVVDASGKVVSLNCYRPLRDAQDMERVRTQTRAWGDAVAAANPAPAGDSHALGAFDVTSLWQRALGLSLAMGVVGLVVGLMSRRR